MLTTTKFDDLERSPQSNVNQPYIFPRDRIVFNRSLRQHAVIFRPGSYIGCADGRGLEYLHDAFMRDGT